MRSGQNERMKRLNNANAPVNTLDRSTAPSARHEPRTSFSSADGPLIGGSKRRSGRDGELTYGHRNSKRLRPSLPHDDENETESVGKSTVSSDDHHPKKITQVRQAEFRNGNVGLRTPRRRRKKRHSAPPRERRSSVGVPHSPEPPRPVSPDELQESSPPRVESDLLPPKPAGLSKPSRPARASTQFPFEASKHLRKPSKHVVHEDISDDELANDSSKRSVKARPQSSSNNTRSQPASYTPKIRLHQAVSGTHTFRPERIVELVRNDSGAAWKVMTEDGKPIGHPWLQLDVGRMHKVCYSPDSEIVEIYRPQAKNIPATLFLQLEHKLASGQFIDEIENVDAPVKLQPKSPYLLGSAYTRALNTARQSGSREWPDHPSPAKDLEPEGLDCASPPPGEDDQRNKAPNDRVIDRLMSSTRQNSDSKRPPSPPSKSLVTTRPRRVTRQSAPGSLFEDDEDPFLPKWSLENTAWENDWDRELVYPSTGRNRATVHKEDIYRLDEGSFLNDSLVFCYLRYLQVEMERERPDIAEKIYFMNTYFFEILRKAKGGLINYEGVKSWTSKIDIFSYDYIVVPVNEEAHWYLAIICNPRVIINANQDTDDDVVLLDSHKEARREPQESPKTRSKNETGLRSSPSLPTKSPQSRQQGQAGSIRKADPKDFRIITLDSLGAPHSKTCQMLRKYLVEEAKARKNLDALELDRKIGLTAKNIPGQDNFCDCGVFLLGYAQHFVQDPDGFVETILQRGKPEWTVDASELRNQVREILFRLHREYRKEVADRKKNNRKKKLEERAQKDSATGSSNDPVPATHDRRSPVLGEQSPLKPQLTGDSDASRTPAREQAGGGGSAGPNSVSRQAEGQTSPRTTFESTAPSAKCRTMTSPQTDAHDQNAGPNSTNISREVRRLAGTTKIRQSIEHDDDQSASTAYSSSSSPDLSSTREPIDDMVHSPAVPSPPDVATYDVPESPPAPLKPPIEKPAEPRFVKRLSSSPRSTRSVGSSVLGEKSPSKRKIIDIEDDDEPLKPPKRARETGKKSRFFPRNAVADDEEWRYVRQPQKCETRGFELRKDLGYGGTRRRGQGRRSSDAIDLTGREND